MRLLIVFSISAVLLSAADQAATGPAKRLVVPPGAVATAPASYMYTDAAGKKWIYHTSPFGVTRELAGAPKPVTHEFDNVRATEAGDRILFENPTPFGPYRWQVKKSELNEMERTVWERQQASRHDTSAGAQE